MSTDEERKFLTAAADIVAELGKKQPREAWLRSKRPERVAAALLKCQHPVKACAIDPSHCHLRGRCFDEPPPRRVLERIERLERALRNAGIEVEGE